MNEEIYQNQLNARLKQTADNLIGGGLITSDQASKILQSSGQQPSMADAAQAYEAQQAAKGTPMPDPNVQAGPPTGTVQQWDQERDAITNRSPLSYSDTLKMFAESEEIPLAQRNNYYKEMKRLAEDPSLKYDMELRYGMFNRDRKDRWIGRVGKGNSSELASGSGHLNMFARIFQEFPDVPNRIESLVKSFPGSVEQDWNQTSERYGVGFAPFVMLGRILWQSIAGTVTGVADIATGDADLESVTHVLSTATLIASAGASSIGLTGKAIGTMGKSASAIERGLALHHATKIWQLRHLKGLSQEAAERAIRTGFKGLTPAELAGLKNPGGTLSGVSTWASRSEFVTNPDEWAYELAGDIGLGGIQTVGGAAIERWIDGHKDRLRKSVIKGIDERIELIAEYDQVEADLIAQARDNAIASGNDEALDTVLGTAKSTYYQILDEENPDADPDNLLIKTIAEKEESSVTAQEQEEQAPAQEPPAPTGDALSDDLAAAQAQATQAEEELRAQAAQPEEEPQDQRTPEQTIADRLTEYQSEYPNTTFNQGGFPADTNDRGQPSVIDTENPISIQNENIKNTPDMAASAVSAIERKAQSVAAAGRRLSALGLEIQQEQDPTERANKQAEYRKQMGAFVESLSPGAAEKPPERSPDATGPEPITNYIADEGLRNQLYRDMLAGHLAVAQKTDPEFTEAHAQAITEYLEQELAGRTFESETADPPEEPPESPVEPQAEPPPAQWNDASAMSGNLRSVGGYITAAEYKERFLSDSDASPVDIGQHLSNLAKDPGSGIIVQQGKPNRYFVAPESGEAPPAPQEPPDPDDIVDNPLFGFDPVDPEEPDPDEESDILTMDDVPPPPPPVAGSAIEPYYQEGVRVGAAGDDGYSKLEAAVEYFENPENESSDPNFRAKKEGYRRALDYINESDGSQAGGSLNQLPDNYPAVDENYRSIVFKHELSSDKNKYLSNFAEYGFEEDGVFWRTLEHYFQAMKFAPGTMGYVSGQYRNLRDAIRDASSPATAFDIANQNHDRRRKDWDGGENIATMRHALRLKFANTTVYNGKTLAEWLASTGNKNLIHIENLTNAQRGAGMSAPYWGVQVDVNGNILGDISDISQPGNMQGKLLMELRSHLRDPNTPLPQPAVGPITSVDYADMPAHVNLDGEGSTKVVYMQGNKDILANGNVNLGVIGAADIGPSFDRGKPNGKWTEYNEAETARRMGLIADRDDFNPNDAEMRAKIDEYFRELKKAEAITKGVVRALGKESSVSFNVVSGGARGIDQAGLEGGRMEKMPRIIAYPSTLVRNEKGQFAPNYPPRGELDDNTLQLSFWGPQRQPGTYPGRENFRRNHLIAAFSEFVLVGAAYSEGSGTMDTVQKALAQGKDVIVLPPSLYSGMPAMRTLRGRDGVFVLPDSLVSGGTLNVQQAAEYIKAFIEYRQAGKRDSKPSAAVIERTKGFTESDFEDAITNVRDVLLGAIQKGDLLESLKHRKTLNDLVRAQENKRQPPKKRGGLNKGSHTPLSETERQVTSAMVGIHNYESAEELLLALQQLGRKVVFVDTRGNIFKKEIDRETGHWFASWEHGFDLNNFLESNGVRYVYGNELAPSRSTRAAQGRLDDERSQSKDLRPNLGESYIMSYYNDWIQNNVDIGLFMKGVIAQDIGHDNVQDAVVVFACIEHNKEACHRSLIGDTLMDMGVNVKDVHGFSVEDMGTHSHEESSGIEQPLVSHANPFGYSGKVDINVASANAVVYAPKPDSPLYLSHIENTEQGTVEAGYRHPQYPGWLAITKQAEDGTLNVIVKASKWTNPVDIESQTTIETGLRMADVVNMPDIVSKHLSQHAVGVPSYTEDYYGDIPVDPNQPQRPRDRDTNIRVEEIHPPGYEPPTGLAPARTQVGEWERKSEEHGISPGDEPIRRGGTGARYSVGEQTESTWTHYSFPKPKHAKTKGPLEVRLSPSMTMLELVTEEGNVIDVPESFPLRIPISRQWGGIPLDEYLRNEPRVWQYVDMQGTPADGLAPLVQNLPKSIRDSVYPDLSLQQAQTQWNLVKSYIRRGGLSGAPDYRQDETDAAEHFARNLPKAKTIPAQARDFYYAAQRARKKEYDKAHVPAPTYENVIHDTSDPLQYNADTDQAYGVETDDEWDREQAAASMAANVEDTESAITQEGEGRDRMESETDIQRRARIEGEKSRWHHVAQRVLYDPANNLNTLWNSGAIVVERPEYRDGGTGNRSVWQLIKTTIEYAPEGSGVQEALNDYRPVNRDHQGNTSQHYDYRRLRNIEEFLGLLKNMQEAHNLAMESGAGWNLRGLDYYVKRSWLSEDFIVEENRDGLVNVILLNTGVIIPADAANLYVANRETGVVYRRAPHEIAMTLTRHTETDPEGNESVYYTNYNDDTARFTVEPRSNIRRIQRRDKDGNPVEVLLYDEDTSDNARISVESSADQVLVAKMDGTGEIITLNKETNAVNIKGVDYTIKGWQNVPLKTGDFDEAHDNAELAILMAIRDGAWGSMDMPFRMYEMNLSQNTQWSYRATAQQPFITDGEEQVSDRWRFMVTAEGTPDGYFYRIQAFIEGEAEMLPANLFGDESVARTPVVQDGNVILPHDALQNTVSLYQKDIAKRSGWSQPRKDKVVESDVAIEAVSRSRPPEIEMSMTADEEQNWRGDKNIQEPVSWEAT